MILHNLNNFKIEESTLACKPFVTSGEFLILQPLPSYLSALAVQKTSRIP